MRGCLQRAGDEVWSAVRRVWGMHLTNKGLANLTWLRQGGGLEVDWSAVGRCWVWGMHLTNITRTSRN